MARSEGMKGKKHSEETKKKISDSLLNNSNAEYWTKDIVIDTLKDMLLSLKEDFEVERLIKNKVNDFVTEKISEKITRRIHLKSELLADRDIWFPKWFSYIKEKFIEDETVTNLLSCVDMLCELNAYNDAANSSTNPAMTKSLLAKHYDWVDKTENKHDLTTKGDKLNSIAPIQWVDDSGTDK